MAFKTQWLGSFTSKAIVCTAKVYLINNGEALCGSFRGAAPFVEHFIILSDKVILNQGVIYQKIK